MAIKSSEQKYRRVKPFFLTPSKEALAEQTGRMIKWIARLEAPLQRPLADRLFAASGDFLVLADAAGLHVDTVMNGEEKLFAFYSELACLADGRQMLLPTPIPDRGGRATKGGLPPELCLLPDYLAAALRASALGRVALLIPALGSAGEITAVRHLTDSAMRALLHRGLPFDETIPFGLRIGTPATVLMTRRLAEETDFLDLDLDSVARHALAVPTLTPTVVARHREEILRFAEIAVGNAHAAARFISVSGSLSEHPHILPHLLAMGADAMTASPFF